MQFPRIDILIIEDDKFAREAVIDNLNSLDNFAFNIKQAGNLADGLTVLRGYDFQAIVLDLNLPDSLGLDTLISIKSNAPNTPVVVLTGEVGSDIALRALEIGAEEFVEKRFLAGPLLARTIHFAIERKKAAAKIQFEKAQKELILDNLYERVLLVDKDLNLLWANRSSRRDAIEDLEKGIGRPCRDFWGRDDHFCNDCILFEVIKTGAPKTIEIESPSGRTFFISGTPVHDNNDNLMGAVEVSLETTQLKMAEKALRESNFRYEQLLNNAVDIIYNVDKEGYFTFVNKAVEKILGYTPEELIGTHSRDYQGGDQYRQSLRNNRDQFSSGKTKTYAEFPVMSKNGNVVWLGQNLWQVQDEDGTIAYQAIARDITDLKNTRNALEAAYMHMEDRIRQRTAQLEEAKKQWERTFDAVPDRLAIIDKGHRLIRLNKAMADAMGGKFTDFIGKRCIDLPVCSNKDTDNCPHALLMRDQQPHTIETFDPQKDETLSITAAPLFDNDGALIGCVHVSRDISGTKRAEKALQEQLNFQQKLMDTIPNPIFFKDENGVYMGCNSAFENLIGLPRHQIIGKSVFDLWDSDQAETYHEQDIWLYQNPGTQLFETQLLNANGDIRDVIFNKAAYFDASGNVAGLVGIIADITERRDAERELAFSEERYRTLVESLSEGLIIVDPKLNIVFANKRFVEMVAADEKEITKMNMTEFLDEENKKIVAEQYERRRQGASDTYEAALSALDGAVINALISPKPIFDSKNQFKGSYALVTDITERKKLESQLVQAQKLESIGQLAAGIAHEINTPTQYVLSNTRFLEGAFNELSQLMNSYAKLAEAAEKSPDLAEAAGQVKELAEELDLEFLTEEIPKAIEADVEGLERIAKIVGSMKAFAHPGAEELSPTDLNKAIENTVTVARNEWKYVADVEFDLDPAMPLVPCLAAELNQVFLNIIVNAAQAIGEVVREGAESKGKINITTSYDADAARISIKDDGPGIPEEIQNRVFDPFFTTKELGKGTGQGLAIAYRVVAEQHKGNIQIISKPGEGTEFLIQIPFVRRGGHE